MTEHVDARVAFLRNLIDDAALFPPASEDMDAAVAAHVRNRNSAHGWVQGRFVCTASRLGELAKSLNAEAPEFPVVAILDGARGGEWADAVRTDLVTCAGLAPASSERAYVESVEVRLPDDDARAVAGRHDALMQGLEHAELGAVSVYLEVPFSDRWVERVPNVIAAIEEQHGRAVAAGLPLTGAKLRCGGATIADVPTAEQVADFLSACIDRAVPFKATAGLHHALPRIDPTTHFPMHGFLNVFGGATLLAAEAIAPNDLPDVLYERDPQRLRLDADGLRWRDHLVDAATIARVRNGLLVGFGSCSFDEPTEELTELGILPVA